MKLSVIIVNYNVKYFLEQCLISVFKSGKGVDMEVFVVDNASADGSCQMVKQRFQEVKLIENQKNLGFSYANNQAIKLSKGEYVLLLNPDTVVEEDTFSKCIAFMEAHPEAGSISVKMIDGKGRYLPESKRALPSPAVSFYKIFGLSRLFPKSKVFGRYHLGYLDKNKTHEIEILPGAFMFIRKSALDIVGLLDENFFMYGEDIDLSYRFIKAGFKNYYFPETQIIHYKGESTKKGSINYVILFYKAMAIFARKHFTKQNAGFYILIIYIAISFRALLSLLKRIGLQILLPALDITLIAIGLLAAISFWEKYRFSTPDYYPDNIVNTMVVLYISIWIISSWLFGAYDRPQKIGYSARGIAFGTIIILVIYALLPLEYRFSRILILIGCIWAIMAVLVNRLMIGGFYKEIVPGLRAKKNIAIVGSSEESKRVLELLNGVRVNYNNLGLISPTSTITEPSQLAQIDQLEEFIRINKIDEVIFCGKDISSQLIIKHMLKLSEFGIDYKIAPQESSSVIGSNSIDAPGELYTPDFRAIGTKTSRRSKRILDIMVSFAVILCTPLWFFTKRGLIQILKNAFQALVGSKTWVGYIPDDQNINPDLPAIKPSILHIQKVSSIDKEKVYLTNLTYAKNYKPYFDLVIIAKSLFNYLRNKG